MIPSESLPDALAADLRAALIAAAPITGFPPGDIRLDQETADLPARRIVVICGDAQRVQAMDATARIPFSVEYISPMDDQEPEAHRTAAGLLDAWLRAIRVSKRRALLATRVYLHDLYTLQPIPSRPTEEREATTTIRGEAVVTLAEVTIP